MIFWSDTFLINSSRSNKFLSASVYCVVLLPFLTWNRLRVNFNWKVLAAATNATAISAAIALGANIYCKVPVIAILFANTAAVTAAIAELPLLLWALLLPLPLPLCGGLLQSSCYCHHCICQHRCHQCMCNIHMQRCNHGHCHSWADIIAVAPLSSLCNNLLQWLQTLVINVTYFISFCLCLIVVHFMTEMRQ